MPSSTMLDFALSPEVVFKAPLNTTKLAPVTENEDKNIRKTTKTIWTAENLWANLLQSYKRSLSRLKDINIKYQDDEK